MSAQDNRGISAQYHNSAMMLSRSGRLQEALAEFGRAISLSPHPSSYEQRGLIYYELGDRQAARRDWESALRYDSGRTLAYLNLAWLWIEEGRYQDAVNYCEKAITLEPTLAKAYENRARAYLEMGDRSRGLADLQRARELVESGRDTSDMDNYD